MERRLEELCVCVCSPYAMTFYSMSTFISTLSLHSGEQTALKEACLPTCDLLTARSVDFTEVVFEGAFVCVYCYLFVGLRKRLVCVTQNSWKEVRSAVRSKCGKDELGGTE